MPSVRWVNRPPIFTRSQQQSSVMATQQAYGAEIRRLDALAQIDVK